jgi:hypothetical protein
LTVSSDLVYASLTSRYFMSTRIGGRCQYANSELKNSETK